jgi:hypothetical protein
LFKAHFPGRFHQRFAATSRHLKTGKADRSVIGGFDEPKLQSSVAFFDAQRRGFLGAG